MAFLTEQERLARILGTWDEQRQETRRRLEQHGLTQSQLAETLGTDAGHLSRLLNGKKNPSLEMRLRVDAALHHLIYG